MDQLALMELCNGETQALLGRQVGRMSMGWPLCSPPLEEDNQFGGGKLQGYLIKLKHHYRNGDA